MHTALLWCDVGLVDPTVIAEVSLRLAASLESAATTTDSMGKVLYLSCEICLDSTICSNLSLQCGR